MISRESATRESILSYTGRWDDGFPLPKLDNHACALTDGLRQSKTSLSLFDKPRSNERLVLLCLKPSARAHAWLSSLGRGNPSSHLPVYDNMDSLVAD